MIDLLPRWSDYAASFRLATLPAVSVMLVITVIRNRILSRSGFILSALSQRKRVFGNADRPSRDNLGSRRGCRRAVRHLRDKIHEAAVVLLVATVGSIVFVAITPLLHSFETMAIASGLRGFCMGISQPLILSILVHAAGPGSQGKTIALRTTANRAAAGLTPVGMESPPQARDWQQAFSSWAGCFSRHARLWRSTCASGQN